MQLPPRREHLVMPAGGKEKEKMRRRGRRPPRRLLFVRLGQQGAGRPGSHGPTRASHYGQVRKPSLRPLQGRDRDRHRPTPSISRSLRGAPHFASNCSSRCVRGTERFRVRPRPRHVSGAASNGDDNLSQIEHGSRFDDISGRSSRACRLEALISPLNEDRAADKDDPTLWLILPDQPRRLKTIETRHHDIHRHHLGPQRRGLFHRLLAAGGTAHNLNAPVDGERHLRRLDEIRVVINNENADLLLLWSYHRLIPRT
jgi:hypothetical protein